MPAQDAFIARAAAAATTGGCRAAQRRAQQRIGTDGDG